MTEVSKEEIRIKAHELHKAGTKWHFHILTPGCALNEQDRYAFILEASDTKTLYVYLSDQIEKDLDQELLPLLHGDKVLDHDTTDTGYKPSKVVQEIVKRASELNAQGVEWHHHMLFPDCQFNTHIGQFALIFEDPNTKQSFESITDHEPINDLKQIEPLFAGKVKK